MKCITLFLLHRLRRLTTYGSNVAFLTLSLASPGTLPQLVCYNWKIRLHKKYEHQSFLLAVVNPQLNQEDNNTDSCVLRLSPLTSLLCSSNRYSRQFCYQSWALVENTSFFTIGQRTALFIVRDKHMLVNHFCMELRFPENAAFLPDKVGCVSRNNYSKTITLE